jgi:protein phosphatase
MQEGTKLENQFEIESAAVSDRGLNESRPENEDSYLDMPEQGIFAVADGVGGAQAGEVASQMAVEILCEAFTHMPENADAEEVMRSAIAKANEAIFEMSSEVPQLAKMATTIVVLHLRGDIATIGHVGDSRLYSVSADGASTQETQDHSIVAEEVRAGRMTEEEAAVHPSRNIISRALGAEPSVEIDLKTMMVAPGTSFLLCTDGITRHVDDSEISRIVGNGSDAATSCGKLKDLCFERGAEDNLTAVVVRAGRTSEAFSDTIPVFADEDEDTIQTARATEQDTDFEVLRDEPAPAARFEIVDEEPINFEPTGPEPELVETADVTAEEEATIEEVVAPAPEPAPKPVQPKPQPVAYVPAPTPEPRSGFSITRVLGMLLLLLVGGALGAGGYYYYVQANPPVVVQAPVINEMKTTDIPLTTFEESRRLVDKDPKKFIAANASPREAQDFFLLGRAYLLTGEYYQAKNAFNTAKSKISEIDPKDRQTIANEIEMALAIIASGPATENFAKSIANANVSSTASNTSSANSNSTLSAANH